ncbi:jg16444 [Pararge aegeria aegeria]|uniref:Jg16444 protein n=1 Tax=Pararge aegeria aegeria TaxID=348720 RepID=A0A8S4SQW6_9NEOP|nr:jg16444 [Pararge aegeria aegeria]
MGKPFRWKKPLVQQCTIKGYWWLSMIVYRSNNWKIFLRTGDRARGLRSDNSFIFSFFGWTLADNHLRGCYGVTGESGGERELAMRRAPGLDDIEENIHI